MADTEPCPRWYWEEDDKSWHAYNPGDSDILETIHRTGGTSVELDGKYQVNISARTQIRSDITGGNTRRVMRATWFWEDSKGKWNPHPEEAAEKLEVAYFTQYFGQKIRDLGLGSFYVILDGSSGTGKQFASESSSHSQNVRRGYEGRSIPRVEVDSRERAIAASEHKKKSGSGNYIDFGFDDQAPVDPTTLEEGKAKAATPKPQRKPTHGIWKEGYVGKKSGGLKEKKNIWKNRYLIITTDSVGVYANRTKEKEKIALQKIARCESFRDHRCEPGFHYFCIKTYASHEYLFRTAQLSEVNEWVDVINDAIDWMKNPHTDSISTSLSGTSLNPTTSIGSSSGSIPSSANSTPMGTPQVAHVPPGIGSSTSSAPNSVNNSTSSLPPYTGSNPSINGSPQVPYSPNPQTGGYPPGSPYSPAVGGGGFPPNNNTTGFPPGTGSNPMNHPNSFTPPPGGYPPGNNMSPPVTNYNPTNVAPPNTYNTGSNPPGGYPPTGSGNNIAPPNNYNTGAPPSAFPPTIGPPNNFNPVGNTGYNPPSTIPSGFPPGWNPSPSTPSYPPANTFVPPANPPPVGFNTGYTPTGVAPVYNPVPNTGYNPVPTSTPGYPPSGFPPTGNYGYPPAY